MSQLRLQLNAAAWGLPRARAIADDIRKHPRALPQLIATLFQDDAELRKRAADVVRRITEREPALLHRYADELAGLLASLPPEESRTRWHLGLAVPRVAHTPAQRLRAARLMHLLLESESNVTRCSAIEGIALLARCDAQFRDAAEEMIHNALATGTTAMKSRAQSARTMLR